MGPASGTHHQHSSRNATQQVEQASEDSFLLDDCSSDTRCLLSRLLPHFHYTPSAGLAGVHRRPPSDGGLEDWVEALINISCEIRVLSTVCFDRGRGRREEGNPKVGVVDTKDLRQVEVEAFSPENQYASSVQEGYLTMV